MEFEHPGLIAFKIFLKISPAQFVNGCNLLNGNASVCYLYRILLTISN